MAVSNGYCTVEALEEWNTAQKVVTRGVRERAVEAASRGIDDYCERHFYKVTEARLFDPCDGSLLELAEFGDLVSVSSIKTDNDGDGVFETTWSASDYQLLPLRRTGPEEKPYREIRALGRLFPVPVHGGRVGLTEITGTWGWPAVPTKVEQACLLWAARIFKRRDSPEGVAGWGDFGQIRVRAGDPDVTDLLAGYQLNPVHVA